MNPANPYQQQNNQNPQQDESLQYATRARQIVDRSYTGTAQQPAVNQQDIRYQQPQYRQPSVQQAPQPMNPQFQQQYASQPQMQQYIQQPSAEQLAMAQIMSTPQESEKRSYKIPAIIAGSAFAFILLVTGAVMVFTGNKKNTPPTTELSNPALSSPASPSTVTTAELYKSTDGLFSVKFPKAPQVSSETVDVNGSPVPYSVYQSSNESGTKNYYVTSWDYTNHPISADSIKPALAVDAIIESLEGTNISEKTTAKLGNIDGIDVSFTVSLENVDYECYIRIGLIDKKMIAAFTTGPSKDEFNEFVKTLVVN